MPKPLVSISIPAIGMLLIGATVAPLGAQRGGAAARVDPVSAERGRGVYAAACSFCHGSQATGSEAAPSLVRNYLVGQDQKGELLGPMIKEGRPAAGMPSFATMPPQDLTDVIAFLHLRNNEGRGGGGLPETALLVGDAKAGEAYFNGAGKCNACHSLTGDLKAIGAKYTPMPLTIAFLTPTTKKPTTVKVTLPSGQAVSGNLKYIDEFVVSLDDSSGEYRSWNRSAVKSVEVMDPLAPHRAQLIKYTDPDIRNLLAYLVTQK